MYIDNEEGIYRSHNLRVGRKEHQIFCKVFFGVQILEFLVTQFFIVCSLTVNFFTRCSLSYFPLWHIAERNHKEWKIDVTMWRCLSRKDFLIIIHAISASSGTIVKDFKKAQGEMINSCQLSAQFFNYLRGNSVICDI